MTLFEFLKLLTEEKFPFTLDYISWNQTIKVTVDTFSKIEVYHFNNSGADNHSTFEKVTYTENLGVINEQIEELRSRPERAWALAAKELGFKFVSPYKFTGTDNTEYEALGLIPDFGYGQGVLLTSRKTDDIVEAMAEATGSYMLTGLSPTYYDVYERETFIETLSEWGWIGTGEKPSWIIDN